MHLYFSPFEAVLCDVWVPVLHLSSGVQQWHQQLHSGLWTIRAIPATGVQHPSGAAVCGGLGRTLFIETLFIVIGTWGKKISVLFWWYSKGDDKGWWYIQKKRWGISGVPFGLKTQCSSSKSDGTWTHLKSSLPRAWVREKDGQEVSSAILGGNPSLTFCVGFFLPCRRQSGCTPSKSTALHCLLLPPLSGHLVASLLVDLREPSKLRWGYAPLSAVDYIKTEIATLNSLSKKTSWEFWEGRECSVTEQWGMIQFLGIFCFFFA